VTYERANVSSSALEDPGLSAVASKELGMAMSGPAGQTVADERRRAFAVSRSFAFFVAKIAVAATLCGVIIARIDWSAAWRSLATIGWMPVAGMFAILTFTFFLSAYKWQILLKVHGIDYPFRKLSKYYFVAVFLNNFFPTSIGGDGYRICKTFDNGRSKASAIIAIAVERITGFGGLVLLGAGAAVLLAIDVGREISPTPLVALLACVAAPFVALKLRSVVPSRLQNVPEKLRTLHGTIAEHFDDYVRQPGRSLAIAAISVGFHLGVACAYLMVLRYGAEQSITLLEVMTVLAVCTLAAVLPISINGLGVFEGTFVYLLSKHGVPADVSIIPVVLNRGMLILLSLVGAVAYLLDSSPRRIPGSRSANSVSVDDSASG